MRRFSPPDLVVHALLVAAAGTFLYANVAGMPLVLWDESRTAVNALEMARRGLGLVTTYDGAPDLWNTKPPLLIWSMALSVRAFGASEIALRLPTIVASLGVVALTAGFARSATRSWVVGIGGAALLVLSPGFFGEHAARTADYDALLTLFTTGYAMLGFVALRRERASARMLAGIAALAAAAVMTKGIAGLVPGVGLAGYAVVSGGWRRIDPRWIIAGIAAAGPIAVFLVAREATVPGYLPAAWTNDVVGRAARSLIGEARPAGFYLGLLAQGFFVAAPLLLVVPVGIALARGRERAALGFATAMAAAMLIVTSAAASKLSHYLLPALPFMAIAVAITVRVLTRRAAGRPVMLAAMLGIVTLGALPGVVNAMRGRFAPPAPRAGIGENGSAYGPLLARFAPAEPVTVIDPGFTLEGRAGYAPVLLAYRLIWRARGVRIEHRRHSGTGVTLSCDPSTASRLRPDMLGGNIRGCAAITR